jgi:hypothetical protein
MTLSAFIPNSIFSARRTLVSATLAGGLLFFAPGPLRSTPNDNATPADSLQQSLARHESRDSTLNEIVRMAAAFDAYKELFGSYPPSDFTKLDDPMSQQYMELAAHLMHTFPRCDCNKEIAAIKELGVGTPAQALCFWLGGFSPDPEHPISRILKFPKERRGLFRFDASRLRSLYGEKKCPVYVPPGGTIAPYLFFSSKNYQSQAPYTSNLKQGGKGIGLPYHADGTTGGRFVKPKSFQIVSAGADGDYGGGKGSFPSGKGYTVGDPDNLTNFADSTLGDAIPK